MEHIFDVTENGYVGVGYGGSKFTIIEGIVRRFCDIELQAEKNTAESMKLLVLLRMMSDEFQGLKYTYAS